MHGDVRGAYTSTGTQLANYLYNAWGGESESSTSDWAVENPIRYNGQYLDSETGFYYLRARYYDPSIHRFTSEDPAEDGINWYAYCGNNPVMFSDPSGYITEEEMSMYENNQMAPAAYTYLMMCTYEYYLAMANGDNASMNMWNIAAQNFRETGYTDTGNVYWNGLIKAMPNKPIGSITEEEHYFRNNLNLEYSWDDLQKLQSVLPDNLKWDDSVAADCHQNTALPHGPNIKYVSGCGHFEIVYNANKELLNAKNAPDDMGTYNFVDSRKDPIGHYLLDIKPYKIFIYCGWGYGNVKENN